MNSFESMFPGFIASCLKLNGLFLPLSMAILILSFAFFFWDRPRNPVDMAKFLVKLFIIVLLITQSRTLINQAQAAVKAFVDTNIDAAPENIAQRYKQALAQALNAPDLENKSFLQLLLSANFFQAIIFGVLTLVSFVGMAVWYYIYIFQKVCLYLCWTVIPIMFACFAIPQIYGVALRHLLRICGIIMWPLGWALCATVTDGLIDVMASQNVISDSSIINSLGNGLENLFAVALIALWVILSSVAAPAFIQRLFTGDGGVAHLIIRHGESSVSLGIPPLVASIRSLVASFKNSQSSQPTISSESLVPLSVFDSAARPDDTDKPLSGAAGKNATPET